MTFTTSTFLTRVLPTGVCWICYDHHVDRLFEIIHFSELTVKLKPSFFCSYAPSPSCILLFNVCVQQQFQVFNFRKTHSKIFEKFLSHLSNVQTEYEILLPLLLLGTLYESSIFVFPFFAFLLLAEDKAHKQWSHPPHNEPYLWL